MTPTIVAQDGRVKMVLGSPGSLAIPHTILEIMIGAIDCKMPIQTAVWAPRMSHSWLPDQITFEAPEDYPELVNALRKMGHTVIKTGPLPQGDGHTIWVAKPNSYIGVADWRISGKAAGN
jgi:gamma-glutamyltranspeptidase/glutathione hydrolase